MTAREEYVFLYSEALEICFRKLGLLYKYELLPTCVLKLSMKLIKFVNMNF